MLKNKLFHGKNWKKLSLYFSKKYYLSCGILFLIFIFYSGISLRAKTNNVEKWNSTEDIEFSKLWQQASVLHLYNDPYWLKLLHFYSIGESIGQWSYKSDIVSDDFFLSPNGNKDPKDELKATLKAILSRHKKEQNKHARCKFIARSKWLQSKLNFPSLPKHKCPLFERWANLKESTGISIVYVSAYLKNPASTFGHLPVKFNSSERLFGHSLLRPTLNFGAIINPEDNPLVYASKGLFGGYKGVFTDERFYNFNHVYGENELRDLWEYPINFTIEQHHRVAYHAWELLHNVEFTYYFFLDNCAYRMAELLEMAWDDGTRINTSGALWAIPVDVLFKLKKINKGIKTSSLIDSSNLISSRQRKLRMRVSFLTKIEQIQLKSLVEDSNYLDSEIFRSMEKTSQARIIDALIDYGEYLSKVDLTLDKQNDREKILQYRSKLPILPSLLKEENPKSPTDGTPPMRFRIGGVLNSSLGSAFELGAWANYHDLLGDETGHILNSEVVTLDLKMQLREENFDVTQFQLFNIQKYALNPTGIHGDSELSWRARAGWERENFGCLTCLLFRISGGIGGSFTLAGRDLEYAFLEMIGETPKDSTSITNFGLASYFGLTWSPMDLWKIKLEAGWYKSFYGLKKEYYRRSFDQRMSISQNLDVRFEIEKFKEHEAILAFHYYW